MRTNITSRILSKFKLGSQNSNDNLNFQNDTNNFIFIYLINRREKPVRIVHFFTPSDDYSTITKSFLDIQPNNNVIISINKLSQFSIHVYDMEIKPENLISKISFNQNFKRGDRIEIF